MIRAPFNFVPFSEEVYFPEWGDQISLDIPFSDECSGQIEFTITAHTPIFVKDSNQKVTDRKEFQTFSRIGDNYFIPATTIKGTVRSVLEILSFGKMRLDKRVKFAQREWYNTELYPLKKRHKDIRCGWLIRDKEGYCIEDCGEPYRISHLNINSFMKESYFKDFFCRENNINLNEPYPYNNKTYDLRSLEFKYELLKKITCNGRTFSKEVGKKVIFDENGDIKGDLVVTGQPNLWITKREGEYKAGKFYEFVFPECSGTTYSISQEEFSHFESIYSKNQEIEFLKRKWDQKIPVFFRKKRNKEEVLDFGLTYLYKLPYKNSPYQTLPEIHRCSKPDLPDCIFGYTEGSKALKGRVQFTHAFARNNGKPENSEETLAYTLSSPKASYYPIYIQ